MKGKAISYSDVELNWIKKHCELTRRELHDLFVAKFNRAEITVDNIKSLCSRKGWRTGRDGRFEKGAVPANKGKKMPFNPNSARTQFKKGQLPPNAKYLGHERLSKDGYVEVSVKQTNPHTGCERRYVLKHKWLWEKQNGPVPKDHCLKCLDGNKANCDPQNWELVPRALLPRLNGIRGRGFDNAPQEIKPAILAISKLEHVAREKRKSECRGK